jgi:outer membrane protein insertion porin family
MKLNKNIFLFTLMLMILSACSNVKYLPKGEQLYIGGTVKIEGKDQSKKKRKQLSEELETVLRPKPNFSILGLRPKLYIYNIVGKPKKQKGLKHWLRTKVGEPPVLFSKVDLDYNTKLVQNRLENRGFFNAQTTADSTSKNRRVKAIYKANTGKQFKIRKVEFLDDSSTLTKAISNTKENTFLKVGDPYDLDVIKAERNRIDTHLKDSGFYFFSPDYLIVQVDSTVGDHQVDIFVKVKQKTPDKAKEIYTINKISIYPNYTIAKDSSNRKPEVGKPYGDFTIYDNKNKFKPKIFERSMTFRKGDIYNRTDHNLALSRLVNLGTFKFVKNTFTVADSLQNALDATYYLTPLPRKSIRAEILGKTNSANYTGTELNINWSNRNTFRGAELLTISLYGGLETQISGQNKGYNVYRIGTEANLIWPRFIVPFTLNSSSAFVPKTKATLGYEFQNRTNLYSLNSFRASFGYIWKENVRKEHQLNLMEINYVNSFNITDLYKQQIALNPTLSKVTDKQLIFGPNYSFTFTNTTETRKTNTFYYKGSLDLSGNAAGLFTGANAKKGNVKRIFDVAFSQYVKTENDFRHYLKLGKNSQLASRIIVGAGLPYGNSTELPFIKQFFIGGTNSIRAFRARSIGPGTYFKPTNANSFLPDQSGDLKLELNTEYRTKLFSIVRGALFVDAGNIWLLNKNPLKPGSEISNDFLNELGAGVGAGLRFDLSFLVLRTDLAFPIRKPYLPSDQRWVFNQIDFGSPSWRKENLVFNLAIGYPF